MDVRAVNRLSLPDDLSVNCLSVFYTKLSKNPYKYTS